MLWNRYFSWLHLYSRCIYLRKLLSLESFLVDVYYRDLQLFRKKTHKSIGSLHFVRLSLWTQFWDLFSVQSKNGRILEFFLYFWMHFQNELGRVKNPTETFFFFKNPRDSKSFSLSTSWVLLLVRCCVFLLGFWKRIMLLRLDLKSTFGLS